MGMMIISAVIAIISIFNTVSRANANVRTVDICVVSTHTVATTLTQQ